MNLPAIELNREAFQPQESGTDRGSLGGIHAPTEIKGISIEDEGIDPFEMSLDPPQLRLRIRAGGK